MERRAAEGDSVIGNLALVCGVGEVRQLSKGRDDRRLVFIWMCLLNWDI